MSHFAVMVRLPADTKVQDFEDALQELLIPYKEYGCGDKDTEESRKHLVFEDKEDEYKEEYETKTSSMVRLTNGEEYSAFDDRFKNPEGPFAEPRYVYPEGAVEFEKPHKEKYGTFEQYMKDWHGHDERDKEHNRYGHWHNPNDKWDWWTIGGRWTGHFLIGYEPSEDKDNYKVCWLCHGTGTRADGNYPEGDSWARKSSPAGHPVIGKGCNGCSGTGWEFKWSSDLKPVGNFTRIKDLDWKKIEEETRKGLDKFWEQWQEFCNGKEFSPFEGPRDRALSLGLLECKDMSELTGKEWKVIPWDKEDTPEDEKRNRCDVLRQTTKEWLLENAFDYFSPISSWARLDAKHGWQEKGEMGWWAANDSTPESTRAHVKGQRDWIKEGNPEDWLVIVDAHI